MRLSSRSDFTDNYFAHFPPEFARQVLSIIEGAAKEAADFCESRFPTGNFAPTQGHLRRQFIHEGLYTTLQVDGIVPETRGYRGQLLDGDERISNFVLLMARDVGLTIYRASRFRPIPDQAPLRNFLVSAPFGVEPLFPEFLLDEASLPRNLRAMYFVAYFLDPSDPTGRTVEDVEVLVLDGDGKSIFARVADLRQHAQMGANAVADDEELEIGIRRPEPSELPGSSGPAATEVPDEN